MEHTVRIEIASQSRRLVNHYTTSKCPESPVYTGSYSLSCFINEAKSINLDIKSAWQEYTRPKQNASFSPKNIIVFTYNSRDYYRWRSVTSRVHSTAFNFTSVLWFCTLVGLHFGWFFILITQYAYMITFEWVHIIHYFRFVDWCDHITF